MRDDFGNVRVLYSLRHTYANRKRYEGMSFDNLSVQMGTSVKMLEEYYSRFTVSDNPNLFRGHAKRQQANRDRKIAELKKQIGKLRKKNGK